MHPADIQAELKKRDITQHAIAEALEVSDMQISGVINKTRDSDRVMRHVSELIGKDHHEVFSEYYFRKNRREKKAA